MSESTKNRADVRSRIVEAAARLLRDQGPSAVTTRGVAEEAGVQAPTIYRLFGDKDGLLDSVAEHVMDQYVTGKAAAVHAAATVDVDPVDDMRAGWNHQMEFGLANPALFRLLSDPERSRDSPAARSGRRVLETRVHRIAVSGRLRVSEHRAVDLIQAAGIGTVQVLLSVPPEQRDPDLADAMYQTVLDQILTEPSEWEIAGVSAHAVALQAAVPDLDRLTTAEKDLLHEWLNRIVEAQNLPTGNRARSRREL